MASPIGKPNHVPAIHVDRSTGHLSVNGKAFVVEIRQGGKWVQINLTDQRVQMAAQRFFQSQLGGEELNNAEFFYQGNSTVNGQQNPIANLQKYQKEMDRIYEAVGPVGREFDASQEVMGPSPRKLSGASDRLEYEMDQKYLGRIADLERIIDEQDDIIAEYEAGLPPEDLRRLEERIEVGERYHQMQINSAIEQMRMMMEAKSQGAGSVDDDESDDDEFFEVDEGQQVAAPVEEEGGVDHEATPTLTATLLDAARHPINTLRDLFYPLHDKDSSW